MPAAQPGTSAPETEPDAPTLQTSLPFSLADASPPSHDLSVSETGGDDRPNEEAADDITAGDERPDFELVAQVVGLLLARAQSRDDIATVLSALDGVPSAKREYFKRNPDVVRLVAEQDIDSHEITAWAYRKGQLGVYQMLMRDVEMIEAYKLKHSITADGEEPVWQHFFEHNRWIFGMAFDYFFNESISKERLEQSTTGHTFMQAGKRPDAILASAALIRSLCFVEIKTPRKRLLMEKIYRADVWSPSEDLSGAVAQSQKTVYRALRSIQEVVRVEDEDGLESGEPIFCVQPRALVVIGTLDEFFSRGEVRKRQFSSFELFRRNLWHPEVLTFDELFTRAQRLVQGNYEHALVSR